MNLEIRSKYKVSKVKLIIAILLILITVGMALNYNLKSAVRKNSKEIAVTDEERKLIKSIFDGEGLSREDFDKEYNEHLEELKKNNRNIKNDMNIGKVYYYLGANAFAGRDYDKATEYFNNAIDILDKTTNYYYLLKAHDHLMNIHFVNVNQVQAMKHGAQIYSILNNSDITSVTKEQQNKLRMSVLCGITSTASTYEMTGISKRFYDELVELTENNKGIEDNVAVYAKYQYNLSNGYYDEAKKYALEYIKKFNESDEINYGGANIYLLEALVYKEEFDNIQQVFDIVETAYNKIDEPVFYATLDKFKGMYHSALGNYEEAVKYYDKSIANYEAIEAIDNSDEVNNWIIKLNGKVDLDIEHYIEKSYEYKKTFNYNEKLGEISEALIEVAFQKNKEANSKMEEEALQTNKVNNISSKVNIVFMLVIILLFVIAKRLKNEITIRKEKEIELENMVKTDYLTGAYSKKYIFSKIDYLMKANKKFNIILFDLDNFKKINDNYGHCFGDEVLVKVVSAIKEVIKGKGEIARFGGEEFIVLLDRYESEDIIEDIRKSVKNIILTEDVTVTISGGFSKWNGEAVDVLLGKIDKLLYEAKSEGKDKIKY